MLLFCSKPPKASLFSQHKTRDLIMCSNSNSFLSDFTLSACFLIPVFLCSMDTHEPPNIQVHASVRMNRLEHFLSDLCKIHSLSPHSGLDPQIPSLKLSRTTLNCNFPFQYPSKTSFFLPWTDHQLIYYVFHVFVFYLPSHQ